MHKSTHIDDDERDALAGVSASSSSARRAGQTNVIPFPQAATAALVGFEDEEADTWEPVGLLAIRLVMRSKYPRIWCELWGDEREEDPSPL